MLSGHQTGKRERRAGIDARERPRPYLTRKMARQLTKPISVIKGEQLSMSTPDADVAAENFAKPFRLFGRNC